MTSLARRLSKGVFAGLDLFSPALRGPRILIYHQIGGGSGKEMEVEPSVFQSQLDWLVANRTVESLDKALSVDSGVVLTFDDGYRSLYDVAYPLLKERGLPFTLYLTTDPVESGVPLREHPGGEPLDWDMVREMLDSGLLTLAAHTHRHPDLRMADADTIAADLSRCDALIAERTGVTPRHFAYPWGYWAQAADGLVRQRYATASLGSPLPFQRSSDPHYLYRLPVQLSDGIRWFQRRVSSGFLFEESLRRRLRSYAGP